MLGSMYSGISGMQSSQRDLDVISNNIANSQTTGYKSSSVTFENMLSQTVQDASGASLNAGGTNAQQVGMGTKVEGINKNMTSGSLVSTGRSLDNAIDGNGYFIVASGPTAFQDNLIGVNQSAGTHNVNGNSLTQSGVQLSYTRDGSFSLDSEGNLVTSDGHRVMGYPLSNDRANVAPTAVSPNSVGINASGFTFQFGPGEALNGYSVVLGTIAPGTTASASVDKTNKVIILNGDFSAANSISKADAETAVNNALSQSGIAQSVSVNGTSNAISGISSDKVSGGADNTAPSNVQAGGFSFSFGKGSNLNGYQIVIGNVSPGQSPRVSASISNKTITINGDFTSQGAITSNDIQSALNSLAIPNGQSITVSGSPTNISASSSISGGANAVAPTPSPLTVGGLSFDFTNAKTAQLNGDTIQVKSDTTLAANSSSVSLSNGKITITYNGTPSEANLESAFNGYFGLTAPNTVTITPSTISDATSTQVITGGVDKSSTATVAYNGLQFQFKYDPTSSDFSKLNNYNIVYGNIAPGTATSASVDTTRRTITINGDFTNPSAVNLNTLGTQIQSGLSTILGAAGTVTVSGYPTTVSNTTSSTITGGTDLKAPDSALKVAGINFSVSPGAALNGYTVEVGDITAGTTLGINVDTTNKTIIINGDFVTPGVLSETTIASAINTALQLKGINQNLTATSAPVTFNGTTSGILSGGTPVESITNDGTINFVDGQQTLYAYDSNLKSIRIPDTVYDPSTGTNVKVKGFTVDKNGTVTAQLQNNKSAALGQIALASFRNDAGLTDLGNNLYAESVNSGNATLESGINTTGEDNTSGKAYGDIVSQTLEQSNVDLATQFTNMIEASRAFSANGKIISTGDDILQDIINLKR